MLGTFCPWCGRIVPKGARCDCRPKTKRPPVRDKEGERKRKQLEPWRANYTTGEYQHARQEAIARTRGRCTDCGRVCAWHDGKKWRTAGMGGEVDHVRALSEGGTNEPANLELRCKKCHAKRDADRRKRG